MNSRKSIGEPQPVDADSLNHASLFRTSTVVYGLMAALGLAIIYFGHKNLAVVLHFPLQLAALRLVGIGLLGAGVLLIASYQFENYSASYRELKGVMTRLLGPCSIPMTLYLAAISALAEELLFRGAIQPFAGLLLTSVLFGLLHLGRDGKISTWSIWAVLAGLLLGWMFSETGSLWPPIVAHFGVNSVSILSFRRAYRQWLDIVGHEPAVEKSPDDPSSSSN